MGRHYGIGYLDKKELLFNDRALAMQVPRETPDEPIASATLSTGQ
jgi:hypothetical protein